MRLRALIPEPLKFVVRRALGLPRLRPIDRFMRAIPGLIHIGANSGQERHLYRQLGLHVLWIEADPEVFQRLCENTANSPRQRAINALVSDVDGAEVDFYIANNEGLSSSMFAFSGHARAWPHVQYVSQRRLVARRLDQLLEEQNVNLANYRALVLDVQGAELPVLAGATATLPAISWIRLPAPDFDAYRGAPEDIGEIGAFLERQGFTQVARLETAVFPDLGTTSEFLFRRRMR
jgi:FkbM family methyltransferase